MTGGPANTDAMRALAWAAAEDQKGEDRLPPREAADLEALLPACREGDRVAFARLFEACKDRVYALALHLSGDPFEAGDVTQEVFLKLLTRVSQFREEARFTTWLHRVVVNTWRDSRRGRVRLVSLEHPAAAASVHPPGQEQEVARAERRRRVAAGLARVREEFREVLVLRFVSGLSYGEIAEVCGVPAGTVASRLSRGLRDLGRALEESGGERCA